MMQMKAKQSRLLRIHHCYNKCIISVLPHDLVTFQFNLKIKAFTIIISVVSKVLRSFVYVSLCKPTVVRGGMCRGYM